MRAMVLDAPRTPLRAAELPAPEPGEGEVLIHVAACGVCRTDLHVVDGELPEPKLPLVPGHQIVGHVASSGPSGSPRATEWGCPGWAGPAASAATAARRGRTSATARASPATTSTAATRRPRWRTSGSASRFPTGYPDLQAAPLLCAGLIGYRALRLAGDAERLGLYGFGAAAHIVCQVAATRAGGCSRSRARATMRRRHSRCELGAEWAGDSTAPA